MKKVFIIVGILLILTICFDFFYENISFRPPDLSFPSRYQSAIITLERVPCFGSCPAYKLTVHGDGRVIYEGYSNVAVTGTRTGRISSNDMFKLVNQFDKIGFFSLNDQYSADVTDLPTVVTSIKVDLRVKTVKDYYGAPENLHHLEDMIDLFTNSQQWVKGANTP